LSSATETDQNRYWRGSCWQNHQINHHQIHQRRRNTNCDIKLTIGTEFYDLNFIRFINCTINFLHPDLFLDKFQPRRPCT
jgi:hypothetical protein